MNVDILLRKRIFSAGIDAAIVAVLYSVTYYSLGGLHIPYHEIIAYADCYLITIVFPVFVWTGQSIGKKLMGLKVVVNGADTGGRGIIFVRELCKAVLFTDVNALTLAVFLAFPLLNKSHRALHDVIAKTSVVQVSECKVR